MYSHWHSRDAEFLYVNCSHALIRWLNPDVPDAVKEAERLAEDPGLRAEVRMNLFLALERCKNVRWDNMFENAGSRQGRRVRSEAAKAQGLTVVRHETP